MISIVKVPLWAKKVIKHRAMRKGRSYHDQLSIAIALTVDQWKYDEFPEKYKK